MRSCSKGRLRVRQRGFSFLWTLVLVAMLAVGLSAATEIYQTSLHREQERELLAIGRQFRQALAGYYETQLVAGKREYPAALEDLLRDRRFPGMKRHLRKIFVDPATGKAEWGLVRVGGRIVGIHSLSDRPPIKRENFDQDDIAFQGKEKLSEWVFLYPPGLIVKEGTIMPMTDPFRQPGTDRPFPVAPIGSPQPIGAPQGIGSTQPIGASQPIGSPLAPPPASPMDNARNSL